MDLPSGPARPYNLFIVNLGPLQITMNIIEEVDDTLAKLVPSSTLVLELTTPAGQSAKFKSHYIGYVPEQFILLQHPDPANKAGKFTSYLQKCTHITIRGVIEGHEGLIIAFQTQVKSIVTAPTRMLVLAVPVKMAVQYLRKVTRFDTDISVETKIKNQPVSGIMENLSPLGCLLNLQGVPESLSLKEGTEILIKVDDQRFAKPTKATGEICNVKKHHLGHHLGIKFGDRSRDAVLTLINQTLFYQPR